MERAVVEAISMGTVTRMGVAVTLVRVPIAVVICRTGRFVVAGTAAVGFAAQDTALGPRVLLSVRFGELIRLFSSALQINTGVYGRTTGLAEATAGQKLPWSGWGPWRAGWSLFS